MVPFSSKPAKICVIFSTMYLFKRLSLDLFHFISLPSVERHIV